MCAERLSVSTTYGMTTSSRIAEDNFLQVCDLNCDVSEHGKEWWQRLASLEVILY